MSERPGYLEVSDDGVRLRIKVVPGARQNVIAGTLGDRLKIRVSAPPEGGKANKAIISLLARTLGIKTKSIELTSGQSNTEKVFSISGVSVAQLVDALE